jgi:hypothetical protein
VQTGEVVTIPGEAEALAEDDDLDDEEIPEWQIGQIEDARKVTDSDRYLRLPDKFDVHEWDIMRRFSRDKKDWLPFGFRASYPASDVHPSVTPLG